MRARQIFESPDIISYPDLQYNSYGEPVDENEWSPQFGDEDSHPIWLSDGELVLGKARDAHPLNIRHTEDFYPGRLWKERKMISFWVYPEKDLFFKMIEGLSARLSRYYNENIDILRDPEWKIEILPQKKEAWRGLAYVKERNPEVWHSELIPVKDYEGSAQRSAEDLGQEHVKSPMMKKERDKVGGSKKYGKEKPLPWRQALVPESLEESMEFERGQEPYDALKVGRNYTKTARVVEITDTQGNPITHPYDLKTFFGNIEMGLYPGNFYVVTEERDCFPSDHLRKKGYEKLLFKNKIYTLG